MSTEPSCSCCGVPTRIYQIQGHDPECIWYEDSTKLIMPVPGTTVERRVKRVLKGWGWEDWLWNGVYCGKILHFFEGKCCSWHYHKMKEETFLVSLGRIQLTYGWNHDIEKADVRLLNTGDAFHVSPGLVHRMRGYEGDAEIIEFSTHHMDSDSYRVLKGD